MSEREGKRAAARKLGLAAAAEIEIPVMQVNVGMTDAAMPDTHQNFRSLRLRRVDDFLAERFAVVGENLARDFRHGSLSHRGGNIREPHKTFDRNFFRAPGRFDFRRRKKGCGIEP